MNEHQKSELFKKVEQFVIDSFGPNHISTPHLKKTADWLIKLRPDADEALLIAAISHDIQRAEGDRPAQTDKEYKDFDVNDYLTYHQEKGAAIMEEFLTKEGASPETVQKVRHLVSRHELGGDDDQNLIKDADSLSFLENNINPFIRDKIPEFGFDDVKKKFEWMFDRITSDKAKKLAEPFYKDAMRKLNEIRDSHKQLMLDFGQIDHRKEA